MQRKWSLIVLLLVLMLAAACSSDKADPADPSEGEEKEIEQFEPVTLRILPRASVDEAMYDRVFVQGVKEKYPHITLERVAQQNIDNLIVANDLPDIIGLWNGQLKTHMDLQVVEDLQPLARKFGTDLSRYQKEVLDAVMVDGMLTGLPYAQNFNVLYYNPDIFDRFGVDYPGDGMTWQDAIALGRSLTRMEDGVQYRGLDPEGFGRLVYQRALNFIDTGTNRASVNNESMVKVLQTVRDIYAIPGNLPNHVLNQANSMNAFMVERNVAMHGTVNLIFRLIAAEGLNWDVAQYPSFDDLPDQFGMVDAHLHYITPVSKHKDDAYRVIELITSKEMQTIIAADFGNLTILNDPEVIHAFARNIPGVQDKDYSGVFKSKAAPAKPFHELLNPAMNALRPKVMAVLTEGMDINTALREAEEEINRLIQANDNK